MNEKEFKLLYEKEEQIYKIWGNIVKDDIIKEIKQRNINIDTFFKIEPKCRVKKIESLISKAFYRNKNYKNPYSDIQDKVGIRLVVLYLDEIEIINEIIENNSKWTYSKDRDFLSEREKEPEKFGYESVHYVVKNKNDINFENVIIPKDMPCEIQIRTLLQHAYCEMSHNTMYKKNVRNNLKRYTSRSMALIESADYFFKEVKDMVGKEEKNYSDLLEKLTEYYRSFAPIDTPDENINNLIIDSYRDFLDKNIYEKIKTFIDSKKSIKKKILQNQEIKLIYKQPVILLVYYLIKYNRKAVYRDWPLTEDCLIPLYNDLGISIENYS
ncbi:RelA/SpoT domain-containing protein [Paraclostridium tenue]|uniref:RelA/SpoT domain-containing protein n=1 Tax=Paraclostridium tenue TaxID=1737 RepID=A0ABN1LYD5_9FIRM